MAAQDTPDWIGRHRTVLAESLIERRADLRGYPHPYLAIISTVFRTHERVGMVLAAAELLHAAGWDLVSISDSTGEGPSATIGLMRRPRPRPPVG